MSAALARYIDPPVELHPQVVHLRTGVDVVVLEVGEFQDVPHLCKRGYPEVLTEGRLYVRPRGKPESVPIPSAAEMRELLELATNKGVREWVRRAGAAGVPLGEHASAAGSDTTRFEAESAAAWAAAGPVLTSLLELGHTDVAIRPLPYRSDRLSPQRLEPFIEEQTVRLRGWPVPFTDRRRLIERHGAWIGQDVNAEVVPHLEAWRLCTSGQFLHRRGLATDLRTSDELAPTRADVSGTVAVWDVLLYMVEVAEFGARMATALGVEAVAFDVRLSGVRNRQLITGDWRRDIDESYVVAADSLETSSTATTTTLIKDARVLGVVLTQGLLRQFGLDLPDRILSDWQEEVFSRAGLGN